MARLARRASDWVDLQWSVLEKSLKAVAPRARPPLHPRPIATTPGF